METLEAKIAETITLEMRIAEMETLEMEIPGTIMLATSVKTAMVTTMDALPIILTSQARIEAVGQKSISFFFFCSNFHAYLKGLYPLYIQAFYPGATKGDYDHCSRSINFYSYRNKRRCEKTIEEASGPAIYSNSELTVSSCISIFDTLWMQSEFDKQNNISRSLRGSSSKKNLIHVDGYSNKRKKNKDHNRLHSLGIPMTKL